MANGIATRVIYPNPFQPNGIEFVLESDAIVTLTVLDGSGHEVESLLHERPYPPGKHTLVFETAKYSTGGYWYRISVKVGEKLLTDAQQIV